MRPLFQAYPQLAKHINFVETCRLPTPIQHMNNLGNHLRHNQVYVKRDDISGDLFGGNKARTLEFLLGAAHPDGGNVVMGLAGTSMALASNIYAHKLGIPLKTILLKQTHTEDAQRNLRYFQHVDAKLYEINDFAEMQALMEGLSEETMAELGHDVFQLSPMSPIGMLGYINAIFELKQQIDNGTMPDPDVIYLSTGLLGTMAGFILGLKLTGLNSKLIGCNIIRSESDLSEAKQKVITFFSGAYGLLREHSSNIPELSLSEEDIHFHSITQNEVRQSIPEAMQWIEQMQNLENITLDLSWTTRVMMAIDKDKDAGLLQDKTVLFWHTYNSQPYPDAVSELDYKQLPPDFWHYFEAEELELLNRPVGL